MSSIAELMESVASLVPYPVQRFTSWDTFSNATKDFITGELGYSERQWQKPGTSNLEFQPWNKLCRRFEGLVDVEECGTTEAFRELGFTPETWECWMAHYETYDWEELMQIPAGEAYMTLGWNEESWSSDDESLYPRSFYSAFDGLTYEQQAAAISLCYIEPLWDVKPLSRWSTDYAYLQELAGTDVDKIIDQKTREIVEEIPFPHVRFTPFEMLPYSLQLEAVQTLGYTATEWNEPGEADIEYYSIEDICFYYENAPQNWTCPTRQAIAKLGFDLNNEDQWDCWMNHYDDYSWSELEESDVAQHYAALGYTAEIWDFGNSTTRPETMKKDWVELSLVEKEALIKLCFIEPLWEGDDLDEWVYKKEYYFVKEWFSDLPSDLPSSIPSDVPSMIPSDMPSMIPSDAPSSVPSQIPTTPLVRRRD